MTIRFPKMHIAASVSNRILNIAEGIPAAIPEPTQPPMQPDVGMQSNMLDAQLITPSAPVELPQGADGEVVSAALTGAPLTDGIVEAVV